MTVVLVLLPIVALAIFWLLIVRRLRDMASFATADPTLGDKASDAELLEHEDVQTGIRQALAGETVDDAIPPWLREAVGPKSDEERSKRRREMIVENVKLREQVRGTVVVVTGPTGVARGVYGPVSELRGEAYADVIRRAEELDSGGTTTTTVVRLQPFEELFEGSKQYG